METKNCHFNHFRNKLIFGGLIIVTGIVLLGLNLGFIPQVWKPALFSWQMLVVLLGIIELCCAKFFKAVILLLAGGFFLIPDLYRAFPEYFWWASENFVHVYWPLLLVAGGIILIVYWLLPEKYKKKHFGRHLHDEKEYYKYRYRSYDKSECKTDGAFDKNAIFGGCDEIFLDEVFPGGEINIVFGGANLDLRRTTLPEGKTYLDINVVFGGVNLYVPNTWQVEIHTDNIAGGFVDNRSVDNDNVDKTRKLIITGSCVFGGGTIES
jgi:predicted membrane protein